MQPLSGRAFEPKHDKFGKGGEQMAETKVGEITHFFDKIGVAVVELLTGLKNGDRIKITGSSEFEQTVESMQMDHEQIESAQKGDTVGLKLNDPAKSGDEIYKI